MFVFITYWPTDNSDILRLYSGLMCYLRYLCLFIQSVAKHISFCVFGLFFLILCTLYCQFLWIVHFLLPVQHLFKIISYIYYICEGQLPTSAIQLVYFLLIVQIYIYVALVELMALKRNLRKCKYLLTDFQFYYFLFYIFVNILI